MKYVAFVGVIALAGCASVPADNVAACTAALFAANTSSPTALLGVAAQTPACIALGEAAIQALLQEVVAKQRARGIRG